jgi:Tfp pilus assembly protein PilO
MTRRDRLVVIGVASAVVLAAVWFLLVVPERKQAATLNEQVATARQSLDAAQAKLSQARAAQSQYNPEYASIVRMGEAVPSSAQVPSLVYELDQLSNSKHVSFNSITNSSSTTSSASAKSTTAGSSSGSFSQLPFTFTFSGSFFDLYNLFTRLDGLAMQTASGEVQISGRLLTIQSVNLTASAEGASASSTSKSKTAELNGTVTATAYTLPAGQGLTGGATPAGPAGAATTSQPASTTNSNGSSTPAAVTQVTP